MDGKIVLQDTTVKKLAWLLAAIALIVYANTLKNDFAYDDFLVIKENTFIHKGLAGIPDILTTPYHKGFNNAATELYRPISLVVFAGIYHFFGANPFIFHLLNLVVFAGCVVALFVFLHRLFKMNNVVAAFAASLLFALHPIHTEVVANCKGLDDLLCFLFAFTSLNMLTTYSETGKTAKLIVGCALYLLSFLSKETAITFLPIILLLAYAHFHTNKKRSHTISIGIGSMIAIAFLIRFLVLGSYNTNISAISFIDNPLADETLSTASRIATALLIMGKYLLLLFVPWPLVSDYSFSAIPFTDFGNPLVLLSMCVYIALFAWCIIRIRRSPTDNLAFGMIFFLATIALFSNIPFLIGVNMAERFLFFPSVGYCMVLGLSIAHLVKKPSEIRSLWAAKPLAILVLIGITYTTLAISRNSEWKDNLTLYTADVEKSPNSSRINFMLGNELVAAGRTAEGIPYLQQAVAINANYAAAHLELGKAMYKAGDMVNAAAHAQKALQLLPDNVSAAGSLGDIYMAEHKYDEAISLFKGIVQREPQNTHAHFNLGAAYASTKNFEPALTELKATIELDRTYADYTPHQYIARIYEKMGMPDSAMAYMRQLQTLKK